LTELLKSTIGDGFIRHPEQLEWFLAYRDDQAVQARFQDIKRKHKQKLADRIFAEQGLVVDPNSIFDIQVKRLHEYKRQLLNALHILSVYHQLKTSSEFKAHYVPHTFIFGAKAAANYHFAKKVIKLINTIQKKVNQDPETMDYLKVVFVENYNVSYAEIIMPSADLSEQISTASKEASGTGNMKFMMNGAVTIGTEDGANVEIHELVGDDNIFIFGLSAAEIADQTRKRRIRPREIYEANPELKYVLDSLINGFFDDVDANEFREIYDKLINEDPFFVLQDFSAYQDAHRQANQRYQDKARWGAMAITNIAKSGIFSSDRSVTKYRETIWKTEPLALQED
jgi:starch phosphorylase